jgi:VanZ family protein
MTSQRSSSALLAGLYLLLLVYASLYPFEGWRWPAGATLSELAPLAWLPWRDRFDEWANLMGYLPFGALLFLALVRQRWSGFAALLIAVACSALLSYVLEFLQHFVPGRFPSLRDWVNNTAGGALGAVLAWFVHASGASQALLRLGQSWFVPRSSVGVVLLIMWPLGLLFPAPVPLGMGQIGPELRAARDMVLDATPLQAWLLAEESASGAAQALTAWQEATAIGMGLAAPCLLAAVLTRPGWRRWLMPLLIAAVATAVATLSTALNFGPAHAWAWMTPRVQLAFSWSVALCMLCALASARTCAALALVALTALVVVAEAPTDPYYAASLQAWERGRFIRFSGVAQWVGLLWPYVAMAWLVARLGRRG